MPKYLARSTNGVIKRIPGLPVIRTFAGFVIVLVLAALLAACGGRSDSQVTSDLNSLFLDKGVQGTAQFCSHQSGNQYVCKVTGTSQGTVYANVTDDGKSIYEQGV